MGNVLPSEVMFQYSSPPVVTRYFLPITFIPFLCKVSKNFPHNVLLSLTTLGYYLAGEGSGQCVENMILILEFALRSYFFLFPFCENSSFLWKLLIGETLFSSVPSSNSLVSVSRTLEGLFEHGALLGPRALLPELQRYKDTVRCGALGAEVPGHHQEQLMLTLIGGCVHITFAL